MGDHEVWECERKFWLDADNFFRERVAPDAIIVLPTHKHPRWTSVAFSGQRSSFPSVDTALLAYEARAESESSTDPYHACCSSTYLRVRRSWMLVAHQESVLPSDEHGLSDRGALQVFFAV